MKKAVIIGAGETGRGLAGLLLHRAEYSILFADTDTELTDELSMRGQYTVFTPESGGYETVTCIDAIPASSPRLEYALAEAELVCTNVGLSSLNAAARPIAAGLARRAAAAENSCINIIACENGVGAGSVLKRHVYARLGSDERSYCDSHAGFVNCMFDRIITPAANGKKSDVSAGDSFEWVAERCGFAGSEPKIPGLTVAGDIDSRLERKLFMLSGTAAAIGAMGCLSGCETLREALCQPEIFDMADGMMRQCGQMLCMRHGFSPEETEKYRNTLMQRFLSPLVTEKCERAAREPQRKLSPNDRIIMPMRFALSYGINPASYYTAAAAMMLCDSPSDPQAAELRALISALGFRRALEELTCIAPTSRIAAYIEYEYERLRDIYR